MTNFWASIRIRRDYHDIGPYDSRESAIKAGLEFHAANKSTAKEISTGYGTFGPHSDIRWTRAESQS